MDADTNEEKCSAKQTQVPDGVCTAPEEAECLFRVIFLEQTFLKEMHISQYGVRSSSTIFSHKFFIHQHWKLNHDHDKSQVYFTVPFTEVESSGGGHGTRDSKVGVAWNRT